MVVENLRTQARTSQLPHYEVEEKELEGPCRSFELDDEDKSLLFFHELRRAYISSHQKYLSMKGREIQRNTSTITIHMSFRGASPTLKCMAFRLTLAGISEIWYNRIPIGSIRSWPDLNKAFLN